MTGPEDAISFKRGSTFAFVVTIPEKLPDGYFQDWEIESQMRRLKDSTPNGLIANLGSRWDNSQTTRKLIIFDAMTDRWPVGMAEMDVLFRAGTGYRIRTKTLVFNINRGITR